MLTLPTTGCFGPLAKRLADREVYPILEQKQAEALGASTPFTIEATTSPLTRVVLSEAQPATDTFSTQGLVIRLPDALALALDNNRDYQTRKEQLYLSVLDLTEARHEFSPIFSGTVSASARRQPGPNDLLGNPTVERFGELDAAGSVSRLFATGARLTAGFTYNALRIYTAPVNSDSASGQFNASIVQPLLQGAGPLVTLENLEQSERDVIYAVRGFSRYRQAFVIDRFSQYLRLIQARDRIDNEHASYQRLIIQRERAQALEEAERLARFQVDQALQDEIRARNRWINARTDYENALNQFKADLGLPVELNIAPDMDMLEQLRQSGLIEVSYTLPAAEEVALGDRLDLTNARMQAEDADRRVRIAENSLLPALNARADYRLDDTGRNRPFDLDSARPRYGGGLELELPLDRKRQRNDYRAALIERDRAAREADQLRNDILVEVREAYNRVDDARQSYEIQLAALELARRRVDNVKMLFDVGREGVSIRDQLEAESDLRDANLNATNALVQFAIARLQFYDAIEKLEIDQQGMWHEQESREVQMRQVKTDEKM